MSDKTPTIQRATSSSRTIKAGPASSRDGNRSAAKQAKQYFQATRASAEKQKQMREATRELERKNLQDMTYDKRAKTINDWVSKNKNLFSDRQAAKEAMEKLNKVQSKHKTLSKQEFNKYISKIKDIQKKDLPAPEKSSAISEVVGEAGGSLVYSDRARQAAQKILGTTIKKEKQYREDLPVRQTSGFDPSKYLKYNEKQGQFDPKKGYQVSRRSDGSIKSIQAKSKEYSTRKSYHEGDLIHHNKSKYTPMEIKFDKKGNPVEQVKRDDYMWEERFGGTSERANLEYKPYVKEKIVFKDGVPVTKKEYTTRITTHDKYAGGDYKRYKEPVVKEEIDFTEGTVKKFDVQHARPGLSPNYYNKLKHVQDEAFKEAKKADASAEGVYEYVGKELQKAGYEKHGKKYTKEAEKVRERQQKTSEIIDNLKDKDFESQLDFNKQAIDKLEAEGLDSAAEVFKKQTREMEWLKRGHEMRDRRLRKQLQEKEKVDKPKTIGQKIESTDPNILSFVVGTQQPDKPTSTPDIGNLRLNQAMQDVYDQKIEEKIEDYKDQAVRSVIAEGMTDLIGKAFEALTGTELKDNRPKNIIGEPRDKKHELFEKAYAYSEGRKDVKEKRDRYEELRTKDDVQDYLDLGESLEDKSPEEITEGEYQRYEELRYKAKPYMQELSNLEKRYDKKTSELKEIGDEAEARQDKLQEIFERAREQEEDFSKRSQMGKDEYVKKYDPDDTDKMPDKVVEALREAERATRFDTLYEPTTKWYQDSKNVDKVGKVFRLLSSKVKDSPISKTFNDLFPSAAEKLSKGKKAAKVLGDAYTFTKDHPLSRQRYEKALPVNRAQHALIKDGFGAWSDVRKEQGKKGSPVWGRVLQVSTAIGSGIVKGAEKGAKIERGLYDKLPEGKAQTLLKKKVDIQEDLTKGIGGYFRYTPVQPLVDVAMAVGTMGLSSYLTGAKWVARASKAASAASKGRKAAIPTAETLKKARLPSLRSMKTGAGVALRNPVTRKGLRSPVTGFRNPFYKKIVGETLPRFTAGQKITAGSYGLYGTGATVDIALAPEGERMRRVGHHAAGIGTFTGAMGGIRGTGKGLTKAGLYTPYLRRTRKLGYNTMKTEPKPSVGKLLTTRIKNKFKPLKKAQKNKLDQFEEGILKRGDTRSILDSPYRMQPKGLELMKKQDADLYLRVSKSSKQPKVLEQSLSKQSPGFAGKVIDMEALVPKKGYGVLKSSDKSYFTIGSSATKTRPGDVFTITGKVGEPQKKGILETLRDRAIKEQVLQKTEPEEIGRMLYGISKRSFPTKSVQPFVKGDTVFPGLKLKGGTTDVSIEKGDWGWSTKDGRKILKPKDVPRYDIKFNVKQMDKGYLGGERIKFTGASSKVGKGRDQTFTLNFKKQDKPGEFYKAVSKGDDTILYKKTPDTKRWQVLSTNADEISDIQKQMRALAKKNMPYYDTKSGIGFMKSTWPTFRPIKKGTQMGPDDLYKYSWARKGKAGSGVKDSFISKASRQTTPKIEGGDYLFTQTWPQRVLRPKAVKSDLFVMRRPKVSDKSGVKAGKAKVTNIKPKLQKKDRYFKDVFFEDSYNQDIKKYFGKKLNRPYSLSRSKNIGPINIKEDLAKTSLIRRSKAYPGVRDTFMAKSARGEPTRFKTGQKISADSRGFKDDLQIEFKAYKPGDDLYTKTWPTRIIRPKPAQFNTFYKKSKQAGPYSFVRLGENVQLAYKLPKNIKAIDQKFIQKTGSVIGKGRLRYKKVSDPSGASEKDTNFLGFFKNKKGYIKDASLNMEMYTPTQTIPGQKVDIGKTLYDIKSLQRVGQFGKKPIKLATKKASEKVTRIADEIGKMEPPKLLKQKTGAVGGGTGGRGTKQYLAPQETQTFAKQTPLSTQTIDDAKGYIKLRPTQTKTSLTGVTPKGIGYSKPYKPRTTSINTPEPMTAMPSMDIFTQQRPTQKLNQEYRGMYDTGQDYGKRLIRVPGLKMGRGLIKQPKSELEKIQDERVKTKSLPKIRLTGIGIDPIVSPTLRKGTKTKSKELTKIKPPKQVSRTTTINVTDPLPPPIRPPKPPKLPNMRTPGAGGGKPPDLPDMKKSKKKDKQTKVDEKYAKTHYGILNLINNQNRAQKNKMQYL